MTGFLARLRAANQSRQEDWMSDGKPDLLYDATELAGEAGELCNIAKKLEREARGMPGSRVSPEAFAEECADVLICLDKLAAHYGVDLEAATTAKFDATSEKFGFLQRLGRPRYVDGR